MANNSSKRARLNDTANEVLASIAALITFQPSLSYEPKTTHVASLARTEGLAEGDFCRFKISHPLITLGQTLSTAYNCLMNFFAGVVPTVQV